MHSVILNMRFVAVLLLCLAFASMARAQPLPPFKSDAPLGAYSVGFRVVEQYDSSRAFPPEGAGNSMTEKRPIQTLIWYPASISPGKPLVWGDYVVLSDTEVSFRKPASQSYNGFKSLAAMGEAMAAVRDAKPAPGRFPVVIYAPSFSSGAWENAELCEYLASWGYVVIASPGMGVGHKSTHDLAGVEAQASDISFLIDYVQSIPQADTSRLAVAGFSWGGLSSVFAAAKDGRIQALVGLDGSIRYWPGLVKAAGIDPARIKTPLLYFKSQKTLEQQADLEANFTGASGPSVLNGWTGASLYSVEMLRMVHPEFATMVYRNPRFWAEEFDGLQPGDYSRDDGIKSYAFVERYTRAFLDAYIKGDAGGLSFLKAKPAENGVPPHFLVIKTRPAKATP